jgi:hypothetical protein
MTLVASVRDRCAWVAANADAVQIDDRRIAAYAASLPLPGRSAVSVETDPDEREILASRWLTLNAINFGSGWFPTLRKPEGTGYRTIAAGVRRRFDSRGPWTAEQLTTISRWELARALGQDPRHELIALFAVSLRDLGGHLLADYGGSFAALVDESGGSAVRFAQTLAAWPSFSDVSTYKGQTVPFLKRAQIAAADLGRAGVVRWRDLSQLTMFADNLVPHVLRLDGILRFEPGLVARIQRGELIEHGSPEEVEIRACAVHAVEMIVTAAPGRTTAAEVDQILWQRGQGASYKAAPRHRSRCTAY